MNYILLGDIIIYLFTLNQKLIVMAFYFLLYNTSPLVTLLDMYRVYWFGFSNHLTHSIMDRRWMDG